MTDLCEAVRHGAEFLDEKEPGWAKRVNLRALNLGSWKSCVLGQLHGDYDHGLTAMGLDPDDKLEDEDWEPLFQRRYDLGFDLPDNFVEGGESYRPLTACWKDEIRARRAKS